jgi:hypothetical protein
VSDEPGLFDLPEPERPARPRVARGRARETFARRVVVDVAVLDAAALRTEALRIVGEAITIGEYDAHDADLLPAEDEIAAGVAAAVQWCVEPTEGTVAAAGSGCGSHRRDRPVR